ncbi:hypothetical protein BG015_011970 [Linnemannia schmuckeri]|uniref:Uncharacterized protein n=1 Tax=Linnemannia schmuckeri TaxID=64567 RepID=A0A9P5VED5_9FUNG|nr:hypothetical protein BG015_011970 [Linnemannia schmuckeri]
MDNPEPGSCNSIYPATFTADQKRMLVFQLPASNAVYEFRVEMGTWVQSSLAFADMKWQGVGAVTEYHTLDTPGSVCTYGTVRFETRWYYENVRRASKKSILYWGGYQTSGVKPTENVVTEVAVDTMTSSNMKTTGIPPSLRGDHCMAISEDGFRMVVFGGRVKNVPSNEDFVRNIATGAWAQGPSADTRMCPACTITEVFSSFEEAPPLQMWSLVPPKIPTAATPGSSPSLTTPPSSPSSPASRPDSPSGSLYGTNTSFNNKESSANLGAIVGGVVGALTVISAAVGFLVYRRKQQQQPTQKGVPLLSIATTHSDNNSIYSNNINDHDDDEQQDHAKVYAAGFGPAQSIAPQDKQTLAAAGAVRLTHSAPVATLGGSGYDSSAVVAGTPKQVPQAIV